MNHCKLLMWLATTHIGFLTSNFFVFFTRQWNEVCSSNRNHSSGHFIEATRAKDFGVAEHVGSMRIAS